MENNLFWLGLLSVLMTTNAFAQQKALSVEDQNRLGVSAQHLAALKVVQQNKPEANPEIPGLALEQVLFTNAGGNRWLWRLDFAGEFPEENSNIIFYVDTDNNKKTGRQNHNGVDLMVWVENGSARTSLISPDGIHSKGPGAYAVVKGRHLYMSVDIDLHQHAGATVVPVQVLAQTQTPLKAYSRAALFELRGAPASKDAKAERREPLFESENVVVTWGLQQLDAIHDDPQNIVLPITEAELKGWRPYISEYRANSVILQSGKGSIKATVPQAGRYHPAFIYYDNTPHAAISILVNGVRQGLAASSDNDNNQKLFALSEPLDLNKGDVLELRNLNHSGQYRIEDLLLLKTVFDQKTDPYTFNYIGATRPWQRDEVMRITFTSSWPSQASVQYGPSEKLGKEVRETTVPLNNHRLYLHDLKEGQKYFYRIAADDRDGKRVVSELKSFVFAKPDYPAAVAGTHGVALRLSKLPAGATWPVSSGVPLPRGQVFQEENLRLVDASKQPVAAQKKILARWADGSVKWVLLSFLASPSQREYQLQYGAEVRDTSGKTLGVQTEDGILVDTGAIEWSASARDSGGYRVSLRQGGKELLGDARLVLTNSDGKVFTSEFQAHEITLEENGAQQTTVSMRGALSNSADQSTFFRCDMRWYFQRHSPLARVRITLGNDRAATVFSEVKSAVLRFQLPGDSGQVQLGGLGKFRSAPDRDIKILQHFDTEFQAHTPEGEKSGVRFPGWMEWSHGGQNVALAVRHFWQLYPKALSVRGDVFEVGLAPAVDAKQYRRFKGTVEEYRSVYYLMNGNYKLRQGMAFTTELAFSAAPQADGAQLAQYTNEPPVLVAAPEYYRDSKAFGDIGLGNQFALVQRYNEKTADAFGNYIAARDRQHEYGLMNFGDWWGERGINWGNVEYDTQHAFFLQFARSGEVSYLRAGADAAVHNRDIDTVHYDVNPPEKHFSIGGGGYPGAGAAKGRVWAHSIGHTGGYFTTSPVEGQGSPAGGFTSSHTWTEGHYEHYYLTGDKRSLEVANQIADVYDIYATINYDFTNGRVPGWTLIFTMAAYQATGDPFYLNAARIIVDRVLERQTPNGGWRRMLVPGHCRHQPNHHGNAGFMVGVLMTGLKNYAEVTGDQRAKDSVVKAARFMVDDMWVPEAKAFRYTSCPGTRPAPGLNLLIAEGIAYAWRQNQDPRLRRVALEAMGVIVERMDGKGKNISMELRSTARLLFDITEMLRTGDPP